MTSSFWVKIIAKALAVFAVGFVIVGAGKQLFRTGRSVVERVTLWSDSLEHGSGPVALHVPFVPLYVDGDRIGKLDTLIIQRHMPGQVDGFRVVVDAAEGTDVERFAECRFRLRGLENIDPDDFARLFRCATDTLGLVRFGEVVFVGREGASPLFVDPFDLADAPWAKHDVKRAVVAPSSDGASTIEVKSSSGARVRVEAGEGGVSVTVDSTP